MAMREPVDMLKRRPQLPCARHRTSRALVAMVNAFLSPAPVAPRARPLVPAVCASVSRGARPARVRWSCCASQDSIEAAVADGERLRQQLAAVSENRRQQAERTNEALMKMASQISAITAKLRAEAGMPPVADPPPPNAAVAEDVAGAPVASDDDASSAADEPYMDPKNFGYESTAGWQVLEASEDLPENERDLQFRIECDMHGCSLIEVKGDAPPGPGVRQNFIQSGVGFRVGFDPEAPKSFCAMVGNDQWLVALGYDEIRHFKRLCLSLQKRMDRIGRGEEDPPVKKPAVRRSGDGMFNMRVARAGLDCSVEHESKLVWVQALGQPSPGKYCIRAIFMEGRQSECFWASETVPTLLAALNKLRIE
ncbi:ssDNA-binding transcriptional regulator [Gracilaria domingensis]|nr:ssDNA-binding transcriptional regulator [Gracilaria domingensis]